MIEINLFDATFSGECSVPLQTPKTMRYVRNQMEWPGITVFTNEQMHAWPMVDDVQSRFKVGWITGDERCHRPHFYETAAAVAHRFDAVMTHDADLLGRGAPFVKTIRGGSWVPLDQWCLPPKTKNVSMILSDKNTLPGHQLRHAIAAAGLPIDLYGPGHTPIGHDKSIAYRDYRYAVVVEACRAENWFTEHLIDALAFGCIPLYWGCPNVREYFGALPEFETISDLPQLWSAPLEQAYTWWPAAHVQKRARAYAITEDWQIANCLRPFVEAL